MGGARASAWKAGRVWEKLDYVGASLFWGRCSESALFVGTRKSTGVGPGGPYGSDEELPIGPGSYFEGGGLSSAGCGIGVAHSPLGSTG